jgi:hypothetical protein
LYPKTPGEWFKAEVEDSLMALIAADEPSREFTADMVRPDKRSEFDETVKLLCELGCRKTVLFYCLSRAKFPPARPDGQNDAADADESGRRIPSTAFVKTLARRMEEIAGDIAEIERTGLLDPLDERELSGNMDQIIAGTNAAWFRVLPHSLNRRAAMYKRWAGKFAGQKLRRDLLSRVDRLSLSVYVKFATNERDVKEPLERRALVVKLLKCIGMSADKSQIKRELEHFENIHFQAHTVLQGKLQRMHDGARC